MNAGANSYPVRPGEIRSCASHVSSSLTHRKVLHSFFRFLDNDEGTSEDYAFCDAWTALGGEIWIDQTAELVHVGEREFRGMLSPVAVESVPAFI